MLRRTMFFSLAISLSSTGIATAADECLTLIPPEGAYRIVASDGSRTTFKTTKDWFCSEQFLKHSSAGGIGAGAVIPVEGIPVETSFDQSNTSHMESRSKFCGSAATHFSEQQNAMLMVKEGDKELLSAYLTCLDQRANEFLRVLTTADDTTFELAISADNYPFAAPLMVDAKPLIGAKALSVEDLTAGNAIPLKGGVAPLKGIYAFDGGATTAMIQVRTSIGSKTVKVARCASGHTGTWSLSAEQTTIVENPGTKIEFQIDIPPGSCHPNCDGPQGDPYAQEFPIPANEKWSNPVFACSPWLPECNLIPSSVQIEGDKLKLWYKARTIPLHAVLSADRTMLESKTERVVIDSGDLTYGKDFSVNAPAGRNAILTLTTDQGGEVQIAEDRLKSKSLPRGLVSSMDPQLNADGTIYVLRPEAPNCSIKY